MDEELKRTLSDIAQELKTRNDLIRHQQEEVEKTRSEFLSGMLGSRLTSNMEIAKADAAKQLAESRSNLESIREQAKEEREAQRAFQTALLDELRLLNNNFEKFFAK
jgi:hypothetical protein